MHTVTTKCSSVDIPWISKLLFVQKHEEQDLTTHLLGSELLATECGFRKVSAHNISSQHTHKSTENLQIRTQYNKPLYKGHGLRSQYNSYNTLEPPNEENLSTKKKSDEFISSPKCPIFGGSPVHHSHTYIQSLAKCPLFGGSPVHHSHTYICTTHHRCTTVTTHQIKVLACFTEEEALHSVLKRFVNHIVKSSIPAPVGMCI